MTKLKWQHKGNNTWEVTSHINGASVSVLVNVSPNISIAELYEYINDQLLTSSLGY